MARRDRGWNLDKVVLFSGHMTDGPNRPAPRFPAGKEPQVGAAIRAALQIWRIGPGDIGICGAARGGDIIFAEECLARGAEVRLFLPLPIDAFLDASVRLPAALDGDWEARFHRLLGRCTTEGPAGDYGAGDGAQPFIDNNTRMLAEARTAARDDSYYALILWDGREPDGKGGTAEIAQATRDLRHRAIIDPTAL